MRHKPKPFDVEGLTRLERLRRFHGMTLSDMAIKSGVPKSNLCRIVNGQLPDVLVGMRIAQCFDLSVEQVWGQATVVKPPKSH